MRICSPHCGLFAGSGLGGEVYEHGLLRGLAEQGVEVEVLLAGGAPYDQGIPGWNVRRVVPSRGLRWWVTPFVFPRYIKQTYDRVGFDLIRAHAVRHIGPAALLARRLYRLPVPIVTHHHHLDPSPLNGVIERRVLQASDQVITDSQYSRQQLIDELQLDTRNVRVVYCGVDHKFEPMAKDPALLERWGLTGKRVLLCTGVLTARKNQVMLVDVLARVRQLVGNDVVLMLIGEGPLRNEIERRASAAGLRDAVILTGRLPEAEKVMTINLADVFVFSSLLEGFALAPQEAMACAKPVVALAVASLPETIDDGTSGFLVRAGDVDAFAGRVATLLRDDELRTRVGWAGAERVKRLFSWDQTVQNVLKVYREAVDQYAARRLATQPRAWTPGVRGGTDERK
jgi:glycosyltransferase involved in cell wall biosynthesis